MTERLKSFEKIIVHIVHRPKLINAGLGICEGKKVFLCESLCEKNIPKCAKQDKIGKSLENENPLFKRGSRFNEEVRKLGDIDYESGGRPFESGRAHHSHQGFSFFTVNFSVQKKSFFKL